MSCAGSSQKSRLCSTTEPSSEDGWALISVLYLVAMLALLAAATQALLLTSAQLNRRAWDQVRADAALDATITRAVLGISDKREDQRWRVDGAPQAFAFDDMPVDVRVQDQLGLIDLNAADSSMIQRLLQAGGLTEDEASRLTNNIVGWRTSGSGNTNATDDAYAAAGLSYRPRHGAFQSINELRLVLGMTPDTFQRIEPAITVHNGHPAFEPATAPEMALRALHLDRPDEVEKSLQERATNGRAGVLSAFTPLAGRSFGITASVKIGNRTYKRHAVVMLTEDPQRSYLTLAWN
jgi:general secretion pathway protein K